MKKLLLFTNVLTLCLLAGTWLIGCRRNINPRPPASSLPCVTSCYPCDSPGVFSGISGKLAIAMIDSYRVHQWTSYQQHTSPQIDDARAVWFDLARLKLFIREIEASACKPCLKTPLQLGVRLYFGSYPGLGQWAAFGLNGQVPIDDTNLHTVMLVPTYRDVATQFDVDFDPLHWNTEACMPSSIAEVFHDSVFANPTVGFLVPTNLMNHGNSWPPPYDGRFAPLPMTSNYIINGTTLASKADAIP